MFNLPVLFVTLYNKILERDIKTYNHYSWTNCPLVILELYMLTLNNLVIQHEQLWSTNSRPPSVDVEFLEQAAPAAAVCCSVLPDLYIDIQSFYVALADIFIYQLGASLGSFAQSRLTIEDVLEDPTVFHTVHMAKLVQSGLSEQRVYCGEASTGKNLSVGPFFPPADAKNA